MRYIKTHQQLKEGKFLATAGLAGSLLLGSPDVKSQNIKTEFTQKQDDSKKMVDELSLLRKQKSNDKELSNILDEIKQNVNSQDSAKFLELFNKLSSHLKDKYGYQIKVQKVEELDEAKIDSMKKTTEINLFEILGWLGSICLAICGVPQAWLSYKDKHSHGISGHFYYYGPLVSYLL
jgi:PQ loop repeat